MAYAAVTFAESCPLAIPADTMHLIATPPCGHLQAGKGSATLSMAYAAAAFAESCLRAMAGESDVSEYAYVESSVIDGVPFFASKVIKLGRCSMLSPSSKAAERHSTHMWSHQSWTACHFLQARCSQCVVLLSEPNSLGPTDGQGDHLVTMSGLSRRQAAICPT